MEKYHLYVITGVLLAICGGFLAALVPFLNGTHAAGITLTAVGLIEWYWGE